MLVGGLEHVLFFRNIENNHPKLINIVQRGRYRYYQPVWLYIPLPWLSLSTPRCPDSLIWDTVKQSRIVELGGDRADYALKAGCVFFGDV